MSGAVQPGVLLMAVGIPAGCFYNGTGSGVAMVRYGDGLKSLTLAEYGVWISALVPQGRLEIDGGWAASGVPHAGQMIDDLIARGLLVRLGNSVRSDRSIIETHCVRLLALGMGNTPTEPLQYRFAGHGALAPICVSGPVYLALILSDAGVSLSKACEDVAAERGEIVEEFSEAVAGLLPTILASGVALLDVSR